MTLGLGEEWQSSIKVAGSSGGVLATGFLGNSVLQPGKNSSWCHQSTGVVVGSVIC